VRYSARTRLANIMLAIMAGVGVKLAFHAPVAAALATALVFTSGFLRGDVRPDQRQSQRRHRRSLWTGSDLSAPPGP